MLFLLTSLYASFLALIFVVLSVNVSKLRLKQQVRLARKSARGENKKQVTSVEQMKSTSLEMAKRAQTNFAELVPICIILMLLVEFNFGSSWHIHALGMTLVFARIIHAFGVIRSKGNESSLRILGVVLTILVLFLLSILNLIFFFGDWFSKTV